MSKENRTCKGCLHYQVCLVHCTESVLKNRGICEHFLSPDSLVKRGRWILKDEKGKGVCSECNRQDGVDPLAKYCRFCGALMED